MLILTLLSTIVFAQPLAPPTSDDPTVLVGPALLEGRFQWPASIREALGERRYSDALSEIQAMDSSAIAGPNAGDVAFVKAWALLRTKRGKEAIPLITKVEQSRTAPDDYRWLTIGEIHLADGNANLATEAFGNIPSDSHVSTRAQLQLARAQQKMGATKQALGIYQLLAERPDPTDGNEIALWAIAKKRGLSNPATEPLLRRLWMYYPFSTEGKSASSELTRHHPPPTSAERGRRAIRLM